MCSVVFCYIHMGQSSSLLIYECFTQQQQQHNLWLKFINLKFIITQKNMTDLNFADFICE